MKTYGRYVVYVRDSDDDGYGAGSIYGVYGNRESAERKAATINRRIEDAYAKRRDAPLSQREDHGGDSAWAYVMPLYGATTRAAVAVDDAFGSPSWLLASPAAADEERQA